MSAGGVRFLAGDLLRSPVMDVRRNRQLVAEAAGLSVAQPAKLAADTGPKSEAESAPDFWPFLLAVLGEPRRIPRLDGEDAIQAEAVFRLDLGARSRALPVVAVMVRNDIVQRRAPKHLLERDPGLIWWDQRERREAGREGARAAAMGMRKGFPDLFLLNADPTCPTERFGLLEGKSRTGSLDPPQRRWRDLARAAGWHWALFREPHHADDTTRALRCWGWL